MNKKKLCDNIIAWLPNIYYIGTLISLFFILAQVFYAKRSMIESGKWEKAKITIENIDKFKAGLSKSKLAGHQEALILSDKLWPDFLTPEGRMVVSDSLSSTYWSLLNKNELELREELEKMIAVFDAFAYPIIMGYANEMGSYQSVAMEHYTYGNYIMPYAFGTYINIGKHAKLLHRLWRVRFEQMVINRLIAKPDIEYLTKNRNSLLLFEGTDFSSASLRKYTKKLDKELKRIQREIEDFRERSFE